MLTFRESSLKKGGRFLVVGDIHGEYDMLVRLLQHCRCDAADYVIGLGDLIDRGEDAFDVVDLFSTSKNFYSALGNHEALMLAAMADSSLIQMWRRAGGEWADWYPRAALERCATYLRQLPLGVELLLNDGRRIGLVHAELPIDAEWKQVRSAYASTSDWIDYEATTFASSLLWGKRRVTVARFARPTPLYPHFMTCRGVDLMISGHKVMPGHLPRRAGNCLWIDTGAFWGGSWAPRLPAGRLTAVDPVAGVYWQVGRTDADTWGPLPLPSPEEL